MAERGLPEVRKRSVKPPYWTLFVRCSRHKIVEIKIKVEILVRITCEELRLLAHTVGYNGILWVSGKRGGSTTHSDKVRCLQTVPPKPLFSTAQEAQLNALESKVCHYFKVLDDLYSYRALYVPM